MRKIKLDKSFKGVNVIVYHKDCMDGVSSAYLMAELFKKINQPYELFAMQYYENTDGLYRKNILYKDYDINVWFVDFSLSYMELYKMALEVNSINIIDHHEKAESIINNAVKETENISYNYDNFESGATLTYKFVESIIPTIKDEIDFNLIKYIKDRDLWEWKLKDSKEISEFLNYHVKPNDVESFGYYINELKQNKKNSILIGSFIKGTKDRQIAGKIKKTYIITINNVKFRCLNVTENISEVGNELCKLYKMPAAMFFITPKQDVVFSLRSTNDLPDVGNIAIQNGGGGHRNSCGFQTTLQGLFDILNTVEPEQEII